MAAVYLNLLTNNETKYKFNTNFYFNVLLKMLDLF